MAELDSLRSHIRSATFAEESQLVAELLEEAARLASPLQAARPRAVQWVSLARDDARSQSLIDSMLEQFPLESEHGRALMSLAEALLRTPDRARADQLIAERLEAVRRGGVPEAEDWLARISFALLGTASRLLPAASSGFDGRFSAKSLTRPLIAPMVRSVMRQAMHMLSQGFIAGETITEALARGRSNEDLSLCSYDMLGEGARTEEDALRYFESYRQAIEALSAQPAGSLHERSGISVKLSAIEPRYVLLQKSVMLERLRERVRELAKCAARANIGMTIDAEEADRLDLSLDILDSLARDEATRNWPGLGLAIQAYGRRAPLVIDWTAALARETGRRMTVRLVKGAYWDTEIKRAQERGLESFPVFTSKHATDVSYLVCAQRLFRARDVLYPQFATHNAFSIAAVLGLAPSGTEYEFQRLHGMGQALYRSVRQTAPEFPRLRVYAPVGTHEDLLPYLVRRLLENGANSSFVHQFRDSKTPAEEVVPDPIEKLRSTRSLKASRIPEPRQIYAPDRMNSRGIDWGNPDDIDAVQKALHDRKGSTYIGGPLLSGRTVQDARVPVVSPANLSDTVGFTRDASRMEIARAFDMAAVAQRAWDATPADRRARCLERAADLLEQRRDDFLSLLVREAGKVLPDAMAEIREAADFCRYYAARGRELFSQGQELRGPTGERNLLSLHGRGVFACISPWNFPLAIFTGQIVAALMAGNSVVAKPAPATTLIAHVMTRLLHEAGIPVDVLQLAPAEGPPFSEVAMTHMSLAGVAFTGSTATATTINRALAVRSGPIVPLIAETGGVNAMIVDATALPEQVVDDVTSSAFTSAGQRCSAARLMYVQEEAAERTLKMLAGAMDCLTIGDPNEVATDIGPVISQAALERLQAHAARMSREARLLHACSVPSNLNGYYFAPHLFELSSLDQLRTEEFGPILHVVRYRAAELPQVLEAIRSTGYGLTLGVHSRLETLAEHVFHSVSVGNTYVNRNMIGAVVGVQPFGGQGLSGTGPKAGGPHYLLRFANERTLTINTTAIGGNTELLSLTA